MLNITSMMDMMTIILVFLLKSYSTDDISIAASEDLRLPISTSEKPPKLAVNVVVSRVDVVVDGEWVMNLEEVPDEETGEPVIQVPEGEKRGQMISSLFDALQAKAEEEKNPNTKEDGRNT